MVRVVAVVPPVIVLLRPSACPLCRVVHGVRHAPALLLRVRRVGAWRRREGVAAACCSCSAANAPRHLHCSVGIPQALPVRSNSVIGQIARHRTRHIAGGARRPSMSGGSNASS